MTGLQPLFQRLRLPQGLHSGAVQMCFGFISVTILESLSRPPCALRSSSCLVNRMTLKPATSAILVSVESSSQYTSKRSSLDGNFIRGVSRRVGNTWVVGGQSH